MLRSTECWLRAGGHSGGNLCCFVAYLVAVFGLVCFFLFLFSAALFFLVLVVFFSTCSFMILMMNVKEMRCEWRKGEGKCVKEGARDETLIDMKEKGRKVLEVRKTDEWKVDRMEKERKGGRRKERRVFILIRARAFSRVTLGLCKAIKPVVKA